jgi:hypothetical protein
MAVFILFYKAADKIGGATRLKRYFDLLQYLFNDALAFGCAV